MKQLKNSVEMSDRELWKYLKEDFKKMLLRKRNKRMEEENEDRKI